MLAGEEEADEEPAPAAEKPTGGTLSQAQIEAMLAGEEDADEEPAPAANEPTGGTLSQAQIEAMLAGEEEADEEPAPAADKPTGGALSQSQIEAMLSDEEETQNEPAAETPAEEEIPAETESEAESKPAKKAKKAARTKKEKAVPEKKEKSPAEKGATKAKILKIAKTAAPFVAVVAACAIGFGACLFINTDVMKSDGEKLAIKSANAYNSSLPLNSELCVYKAYVRNSTAADECMLYTYTEYMGVHSTKICRVVIEKSDPDTINLYYVIDPESPTYLAMKSSDDPKDRIKASILKNHSDSTEAADAEIRSGSEDWTRIDCSKINANITSEQNNH